MEHLFKAAFLAVMTAPDAELIARANPVEKFVLVSAQRAEDGIARAADLGDPATTTWLGKFLAKSYTRPNLNNDRYHAPYGNKKLIEICRRAYKALSLDVEWLYMDEVEEGDDLAGYFMGYHVDVVRSDVDGTFQGMYDCEWVTGKLPTRAQAKAVLLEWILENRAPK